MSACAERHFNEAVPGALFECVNLGVSGYNLWNAWLSFKREPQIYDAVILSLCSNDAELFGRTFRADTVNKTTSYWQSGSPFHSIITACFDDMAGFARENGFALVVSFNSLWPGPPAFAERNSRKIAQAIAGLCASRSILFLDFEEHLESRRLPFEELVVSRGDYHPSKFANDLVARFLVRTVRDNGWFGRGSQGDIVTSPDRILGVARDVVAKDRYPQEAVVRWADAALASKRRAAMRTLEASAMRTFERHADRAAARIAAAQQNLRSAAMASATLQWACSTRGGLAQCLNYVDEEMLRIDELSYAIGRLDWPAITTILKSATPAQGTQFDAVDENAPARLEAIAQDMEQFPVAFAAARHGGDWLEATGSAAFDMGAILDLAARTGRKARELLGLIAQVEPERLRAASQAPDVEALFITAEQTAAHNLEIVRHKLMAIVSPRTAAAETETTCIDVTVTANAMSGRNPCTVSLWLMSSAPQKLPLQNLSAFQPDGQQTLVRFRFPRFHAGRIQLQFLMPKLGLQAARPEIVGVDVYNEDVRRTLSPNEMEEDPLGRYLSPVIYLV